MRFKIDENLPAEIGVDLRAAGHEADTVADQGLAGASDAIILARVQSEARVLITMDKGIADVRTYPPQNYSGIILLRPRTSGRSATFAFVRKHLPSLLQQNLAGHLFVLTESGIRVR